MILLMKRHPSRPDSSVIPFKRRVPTDVVERARGRRFTVELAASATDPAATFSVTLGEFCKGSLHTRDKRTADVRAVAVLSALTAFCDALRRGPVELSQRQVEALAGEVARMLIDEHGENPGTVREWESFKALTRAAVECRIPWVAPIPERGQSDDETMRVMLFGEIEGEELTATIDGLSASWDDRALRQRVGRLAFWVLGRHGIEVDDETRLRLLRRIALAALDAGKQLKAMAAGDYRPSPAMGRFPAFKTKAGPVQVSFADLFARWQRETKPSGSTVTTWRGIVADFTRHLGHEDAARVSDADVVSWKDRRVAAGRSLKTVADSDLACLKSLYRYGIANRLLTVNPVAGVSVKVKKRAGDRMLGYEPADVARLLAVADRETHPARRWLPWLAAFTGARIGELAALWGTAVVERQGVVGLAIGPSPDGSTVKTEGSERFVPLHPVLIERGFVAFARGKGNAPLFYGKPARNMGEGRHPSKGVSNHLAQWIREAGFTNDRIAPAHGLRHYWKSTALDLGIPDSIADAIQGHAISGAADLYRHVTIRQMADAVSRFPMPDSQDDGARPALPNHHLEEGD